MIGAVVEIGLTLAVSPAGLSQAMPAPLWRGVSRIVLTCSTSVSLEACNAIRDAARARTGIPIETAVEAAPVDRGTVILTITITDDDRSLVAVARRAVEIDEAEGPARYAVAWDAAAPGTAVADLLTRVLPYRSRGSRRPK